MRTGIFMNGRTPRLSRRLIGPNRLRLWPISWPLVVCLAAAMIGLVGVTWLVLPAHHHPKLLKFSAAGPGSPPARVCGNDAILGGGPKSSPTGAVTVPAGDNSGLNWGRVKTTYWFAPGTHTLGPGEYTQIIAGDGSTYVGAPGAVLDGQQTNYFAFGGYATNVTISYLTVQNFGTLGGNNNEGVVNQDSASGWTIDHSTLTDNAGAGTMLGSGNTVSYSCLKDNQQYGFNAYSGVGDPANITLDHDEIAGNNTYNWEAHITDCGCDGGGKFWRVNGAVVTNNWVHDNKSVGLWADMDNRGFDIENNYISGNYAEGIVYEASYNAVIKNNTFLRDGIGAGPNIPGFPTPAIYVSESGSDSRVAGPYGSTFSITGNKFTDNWGGVVLWENADRFCGSPANPSTDCTLVKPSVATAASCNSTNIANPPYHDDCRWKTQNVSVYHNLFDFNPADIGSSCTMANYCGFQGLFSQYGSYPSWSPFKGIVVENHITFDQKNHFASNTYNGPWHFMAHQQGNTVSWATWRASPYDQDAGSTLNPR